MVIVIAVRLHLAGSTTDACWAAALHHRGRLGWAAGGHGGHDKTRSRGRARAVGQSARATVRDISLSCLGARVGGWRESSRPLPSTAPSPPAVTSSSTNPERASQRHDVAIGLPGASWGSNTSATAASNVRRLTGLPETCTCFCASRQQLAVLACASTLWPAAPILRVLRVSNGLDQALAALPTAYIIGPTFVSSCLHANMQLDLGMHADFQERHVQTVVPGVIIVDVRWDFAY